MYNKEKHEMIDLKIYIRFYITRMILRFLMVMFIFTLQKIKRERPFYSVREARARMREMSYIR